MMYFSKGAKVLLAGLFICISLLVFVGPVAAQEPVPVCFWSAQGPVCVQRPAGVGDAGIEPGDLLAGLLAGPTAEERAQGLWSAIPEGTALERLEIWPDSTVVLYVNVPFDALRRLDHDSFEAIVQQIGWTLEPLGWRDLRIQTWDAIAEEFVPLAAFLPRIAAPRKETSASGEGAFVSAADAVGQPPAFGQGQPRGALSGKTVYVSAGHGWEWSDYWDDWRTQRPPYPNPPYETPIIEDHNNAEVVNQYLLQYLWNAGALAWPVRERDMNAAEVVVDNDTPAPGVGYSETGDWTTTTNTGMGYAGTDYRWAETVLGAPTATAVWTATLPADDEYAVYVWYRSDFDRPSDAHYTIHHAGGETTVVVDQQRHGITWHYVGTYGFRGGEVATVTLSNLSTQAGRAVIADAVRFGGGVFDDLAGIDTIASHPPDKPWWEVAAFYYTQWMGLDAPPGDVTARPIYARWEHTGTGDDAVYVSWHTNGFSGYQDTASGTETYVHNGEWYSRTEGSLGLQHAIHTELVHDLRAGWDADWIDRGEKQKNLGELRLLWDNDASMRMPGALIEIAFHDHPDDTDALKDPRFNMLAARAFYQGIVKYFEQRDGIDLVELPEPPTHLALQNVGGGRVRVSWRPSPTDTVGLVGDAATGYRVYTSTDGLGWSNGVPVTTTTAYTFTSASLLFVRVTATNDGGESFPTETLAVRAGLDAGTLLVNGFDRLNDTMTVPETDPAMGYNMRMFLDRMNRYDYAIQHGEVIAHPFDGTSNEALRDGVVSLNDYALVDWILGEESAPDETLDAAERALLADFMGNEGALFLSGTEVGWYLDDQGEDPVFYNGVLRADYAGDDAETYEVIPVAGSIFDGLGPFQFDAPGMYDADYPDQFSPLNGSTEALSYSGGLGGTAAIQYAATGSCERLVYFGFPFETIRPDQRLAVMERVLDFLSLCLPAPVDTEITPPADGSAHNAVPPFGGTAAAGAPAALDWVDVQIERGTDGRYWTGSGWTSAEAWLAATGTVSWTYALPVLDDDGYHLRARAWTTEGNADSSPAEVAFVYDTLSPASTVLVTPTGGIVIPVPVSVTLTWEPVEPDGGSALAYVLVLDGQSYTTTQTAYTLTHVSGGWHTWGVQVFDVAGNRSGWITDTFRYPSVDTQIVAPANGSAHNAPISFSGTAQAGDAVSLDRVEIQLQRASDGRYWLTGTVEITGSAWITDPGWLTATTWATATGTVSWTYPLLALGDDDYYLRARAWTSGGEVDSSPAEVAFTYDTLVPASTVLVTPTGGSTVPAVSGVALVWEPVEEPGGGAPLAYEVQLDGQPRASTQMTHTLVHVSGGLHDWGVRVFDAAGNRSEWVTDTFSVQLHNCFLPVVMRNFDVSLASVLINGDFETDEGWVLNQLAVYVDVSGTLQVRSGARSVRVGIPPGEPGSYTYSSVAQTFVMPSGDAATLHLWVYPTGEGDDADDWHYVSLRDEADAYYALDHWQSDARVWELREYDLSVHLTELAGQTVTLYIGTRNDGDDDTAALYVDDVVLEIGR